MDKSDLDISLDSVVDCTVDTYMNDIGVEVNFNAYDLKLMKSKKPTTTADIIRSNVSDATDTQTEFGVDTSIDFPEIPFTLHKFVGHNIIHMAM